MTKRRSETNPDTPPFRQENPAGDDRPDLAGGGRVRDAIDLLERLGADWRLLDDLPDEDRQRLHRAIARLYHPDPAERRRHAKDAARSQRAARRDEDERVRSATGIRALRQKPAVTTPNVFAPAGFEGRGGFDARDVAPAADGALDSPKVPESPAPGAPGLGAGAQPRPCYVCRTPYSAIHHFYDQLCPGCAGLNFAKRTELADLRGRVALLTGGRVKIGYQAGLKLLRAGAHLIVTTRFPRDAAARYARERDAPEWSHRLEVFGLDLRHTPSVEAFCRDLDATHARLDFIVNNACQTVRRPPEFYAHMIAAETAAARDMPLEVRRLLGARERGSATESVTGNARISGQAEGAGAALLSQVRLLPDEFIARMDLFPQGQLDQDLQQVDLRDRNSWRLLLAEVPTVELLEVQLVNAIAPFVINARLKPLMMRTPGRDKHIVNVSAVEGQFYRPFKTTRHPHTNMAKAALNMMTRTAATDYHRDGIHMNSVDTGWVTDEDPIEIAARKRSEQRFHPPLDAIDGAARIVDPIIDGINTGTHVWGQFLKDYRPADW